MTVDGEEIEYFNNVNMSFGVSEMGTEGVCSACFTFAVPLALYPHYDMIFEGGKTVYLTLLSSSGGGYTSQPFYINAKSVDDVSVNVTCYDRMMFTECDFPCTEEDFVDLSGNEIGMDINTVFTKIKDACGFETVIFPDTNTQAAIGDISKNNLLGKTCHAVLSMLSQACCGYWCTQSSSVRPSLVFVPFGGTSDWYKTVYSERYTKIKKLGSIQPRMVYMSDGSICYGGDTGGADTVIIDTPIASKELWSAVSDRVSRAIYIYTAWCSDIAVLDVIPDLPAAVQFEGEEKLKIANYGDIDFLACGIIARLGSNRVDDGSWAYVSRKKRELNERPKFEQICKNVKITKNGGIKFVYVNENE